MEHEHQPEHAKKDNKIVNWLIGGLVVIAGYFLITEHRAHVVPYLPFLLLAACPFMHFFMHRHHGGGTEHDHNSDPAPRGGEHSGPEMHSGKEKSS